ncbi:hypothetical protein [Spirochaeta cellobiosiphila]|uniref:hypothetical protein n=1 Tax=Spirochaeta cellobiosiphila TaxID=504483 RepID=UPI00041CD323|nr:hypothetical protein [Spirochaeta cellobiosiphila]
MCLNKITFIYLFVFITLNSWTQNITSSIDWEKQAIEITIVEVLNKENGFLPMQKQLAEDNVNEDLPMYLSHSLSGLTIDSQTNYSELIINNPQYLSLLPELAVKTELVQSRLFPDFSAVELRYKLPFYPYLSKAFPIKEHKQIPPSYIKWSPTDQYTGMVIYVKGKLPLYGSTFQASYKPSLYPKLMTYEGKILYEPGMTKEQFVNQWGVVGITNNLDNLDIYYDRIGSKPIYTIATQIYGINNTDLVIPERTVRQIRQDKLANKIFEQGRVLIIFDQTEEKEN